MYVSAVAHLVVLGNLLLNGMRLLHYLFFLFPSLLLLVYSKIGLLLTWVAVYFVTLMCSDYVLGT